MAILTHMLRFLRIAGRSKDGRACSEILGQIQEQICTVFYTMGRVNFGLRFGDEKSEDVIKIITENGLRLTAKKVHRTLGHTLPLL